MNISAIIAEYNPFHKGHLYHIKKTKELTNCDAIICVMSGNFVQRGMPAILDKWCRTEVALKNGIDLVIELPLVYSLSSAEFFSFGSISLLNSLNVVNSLSFGSETEDIEILKPIAKLLVEEPYLYKKALDYHLQKGLSFPKARSEAIKNYLQDNNTNIYNIDEILNSSNNILGIEYLKSLIRINSNISPFSVKRIGESYNSESLGDITSATGIRKYIFSNSSLEDLKDKVPIDTYNSLINYGTENFPNINDSLYYLKYKLLSMKDEFSKIPDIKEGLENKIINSILKNNNFNDALMDTKSKRYTLTRINRILMQLFIGFEQYNIEYMRKSHTPYARVLGFTSKGQKILKDMKLKSEIPIVTKIPKCKNEFLELDLKGTSFYSLLNKKVRFNEDYYKKPIILP
ncbi:nucleotidyltransferase [Hathewaya histolytica]|uniref:tRNA(Met) cytidine acetate ligase n=1 Tax=Hathewaya histolytica TaxID=1498 RepID=A0A4U9RE21_HATHI|nr:nucleotidyltransferase [Hathewaya histolytica]VTQ90065.1 putative nucleotidyltransferase [Hathewaya histolytica]